MKGFKIFESLSVFTDDDFVEGPYHEKKVGGANLIYQVIRDTIDFSSLRVKRADRGSGFASQAMQMLCVEADKRNLKIKLLASPLDKKTNLRRLVQFYQRLGFKVAGLGNPAGDPIMIRQPNTI